MDITPLEQYFELALDLPDRERGKLLAKLDAEQPDVAAQLRAMLDAPGKNRDFACSSKPKLVLDELHHVAVQVTDIARSVRWYRDRFRCRVKYQDDTWAMLSFANLELALVVASQHPPHVALRREDAAAFGPLTEHRDGTRSAYVQDPDGNTIEVLDAGPDA